VLGLGALFTVSADHLQDDSVVWARKKKTVSLIDQDDMHGSNRRAHNLLRGQRGTAKVVMMIVYRGKRALAMQVRKSL
jgi:hypothetical protein